MKRITLEKRVHWGLAASILVVLGCSETTPTSISSNGIQTARTVDSSDAAIELRTAEHLKVLESSEDRAALVEAAIALASSGNANAVAELGRFLRRGEFLARLDDLTDPHLKTRHLSAVMRSLENQPSTAVSEVCLTLADESEFLADQDRMIYLLPALAAVRPMSAEAAAVFRRTNAEGFFSANAPLLAENGSPRALELFEAMIEDASVEPEDRVDALRTSILSRRTEVPILESSKRLLSSGLEEEVMFAVIETLFDFRSKEWFGPAVGAPTPPPWEGASDDALALLLRLADQAKARGALPAGLREAIDRSSGEIEEVLSSRDSSR